MVWSDICVDMAFASGRFSAKASSRQCISHLRRAPSEVLIHDHSHLSLRRLSPCLHCSCRIFANFLQETTIK